MLMRSRLLGPWKVELKCKIKGSKKENVCGIIF
jgi:hypothetical protein